MGERLLPPLIFNGTSRSRRDMGKLYLVQLMCHREGAQLLHVRRHGQVGHAAIKNDKNGPFPRRSKTSYMLGMRKRCLI